MEREGGGEEEIGKTDRERLNWQRVGDSLKGVLRGCAETIVCHLETAPAAPYLDETVGLTGVVDEPTHTALLATARKHQTGGGGGGKERDRGKEESETDEMWVRNRRKDARET